MNPTNIPTNIPTLLPTKENGGFLTGLLENTLWLIVIACLLMCCIMCICFIICYIRGRQKLHSMEIEINKIKSISSTSNILNDNALQTSIPKNTNQTNETKLIANPNDIIINETEGGYLEKTNEPSHEQSVSKDEDLYGGNNVVTGGHTQIPDPIISNKTRGNNNNESDDSSVGDGATTKG